MGSLYFSPVKVSKNLICFEVYSSRQVKGISDCKDFMGLEENPVTSIFLWRVQCNFHCLTMVCLHVDYVDMWQRVTGDCDYWQHSDSSWFLLKLYLYNKSRDQNTQNIIYRVIKKKVEMTSKINPVLETRPP